MDATRVFLCHNIDQVNQRVSSIFDQLYTKLQEAGIEVVSYPGSSLAEEENFLAFFQQQLPACQWFILFETPALASLSKVQQMIDTALKRIEQKQMDGIIRFIVASGESGEDPAEWSTIPLIDATKDFARAEERLLLSLSGLRLEAPLAVFPPTLPLNCAPVSNDQFATTALNCAPVSNDQLATSPSHLINLGQALWDRPRNLFYWRKRSVIILTILLIILFLGAIPGFFFWRQALIGSQPIAHISNATGAPASIPATAQVPASTPNMGHTPASAQGTAHVPAPSPGSTPPSASTPGTSSSNSPPQGQSASSPRYSFEDGSLDGWQRVGDISSLQNSTAVGGQDGTHALQVIFTSTSGSDLPYARVSPQGAGLTAGQTVSAYLYVPGGTSASVIAKIYVEDPTHTWHLMNDTTISQQNSWQKLSFTPSGYSGSALWVGIQLLETPANISTTVYVDSVNWG